ncbi:hypothetical protein EZI54_22620 [Marinobacter halodurans]|uniref:VWFD domain-containing protein n=2 Tax=Marinobacter halodurans TaxID=2528979 RepID=A0ABY1ZDS7_9GAMM|nr:hypothetical protein EZI54_22620 [Marinobacter halodurans]
MNAAVVHAELKPISDEAMSEVTGQAFVSVDRQQYPSADNNTSYTRVNLGMDIEIQTNADTFELGRYERDGEVEGSSDVLINNFSLGYIYDSSYYERNPDAARQLKADGSAYQDGEIVPFKISNPYLEFAYDESTEEIVGFRFGFGESQGILSGAIQQLTGNINIDILDRGEGLSAADSNGNLFDQMVGFLTPVLAGSSPLKTKARLVQGNPDRDNYGGLDPVRAEYIGVPNGEKFVLEDVNYLVAGLIDIISPTLSSELYTENCSLFGGCDVVVVAQQCEVLGIQACFDLGIYNSMPVGQIEDVNGKRTITGPSDGAFISFQTKDLEYLADVAKSDPSPEDFIKATAGAFFNIPNGAVTVNLEEALTGIEGQRREYIDRGVGLF